jgi:hypothetical protein
MNQPVASQTTATTLADLNLLDLPLPNTDWPEQGGQFMALLSDEKNRPFMLILGPEHDGETNWQAAMEWANGLDVAGHRDYALPTRIEHAVLFARARDRFEPDYYWSCEQHAENADYAWMQNFNNGNQNNNHKSNDYRARAVRRSNRCKCRPC